MNENRAMSNTELPDTSASPDVEPESSGTVPVEKHPNLTLLESGQNPGDILRAAREKAGYSLNDISTQTKINQRQLEAIESGDVSRLPPETFAKAFIKSYCRALKIDATPIVASFGYADVGAQANAVRAGQADPNRVDPLEPKMPSSSKRLSSLNFDRNTGKKSFNYGLVLAVVAIMAVFYIPVFLSNQADEAVTEESIETNEAPVAQAGVNQQTPAGGMQAPLNESSGAAETSVFPALQAPTEASDVAAGAAARTASQSAKSTSSLTAPVDPSAAPAAPASTASTTPAPAAPTPAVGKDVMLFTFQGQSWVTVRDAQDKVLHSQLNGPGSNVEVKGEAPFKVIIGNAESVKVTQNGKEVDLQSSTKGGVARITIR